MLRYQPIDTIIKGKKWVYMVKCPECGKNNNDNDLFCGNCGSKMPEPKICPYCEYESFDNTYCTKCGEKLISNESFHIKKLKEKI